MLVINLEHGRYVTASIVFHRVNRKFHNWESDRRLLHSILDAFPISINSIRSSQTNIAKKTIICLITLMKGSQRARHLALQALRLLGLLG